MSATVEVQVNGEPLQVDGPVTVGALVDARTGRRRGVAVAVNAEVVPRSDWDRTVLAPGDRVEILTAAQGG